MTDKELKDLLLSRYNEDDLIEYADYRDDARWTVYIHIVPKSVSGYDHDKYYVGLTSQKPAEKRWGKEGCGYKNVAFGKAIKKYGWNKIEHYIVAENLTEEEAKCLEKKNIQSLQSNKSEYGYNRTEGGDVCDVRSHYYGENHPCAKKVVLLNTGEVFYSYRKAGETYGYNEFTIRNYCVRGKRCKDKDKNGNNLVFMLYEDYIKLSKNDVKKRICNDTRYFYINKLKSPIICLNTKEIFYYEKDLVEKHPDVNLNKVSKVCRGEQYSVGELSDGTKLTWARLSDYNNMKINEIQDKISLANAPTSPHFSQKIIDKQEKKIYKSMNTCEKKLKIQTGTIKNLFKKIIPDKSRFQKLEEYLQENNLSENDLTDYVYIG